MDETDAAGDQLVVCSSEVSSSLHLIPQASPALPSQLHNIGHVSNFGYVSV